MAWRFYATQNPLLTGEGIVSPILEGSLDVGGADPDLIVDRCLIEIKTAVHPENIAKPSWPWQLLAYALLDYDNAYELESVALYLGARGFSSMVAGRVRLPNGWPSCVADRGPA